MRHSYIFILLAFFLNLPSNASLKINQDLPTVGVKTIFITKKNPIAVTLISDQNHEAVTNSLIPYHQLKTLKNTFFLLLVIGFILPRGKKITIHTAIQELRNNHLPLFKMLYQKHVFW